MAYLIYVVPVAEPAERPNWDEKLGPYVLRMLLRRRGESSWPDFRSEIVFDERWPIRRGMHRVKNAHQLEVMIGLIDWERCVDTASRRKMLAQAFRAALIATVRETNVQIQGLMV